MHAFAQESTLALICVRTTHSHRYAHTHTHELTCMRKHHTNAWRHTTRGTPHECMGYPHIVMLPLVLIKHRIPVDKWTTHDHTKLLQCTDTRMHWPICALHMWYNKSYVMQWTLSDTITTFYREIYTRTQIHYFELQLFIGKFPQEHKSTIPNYNFL